MTEQKLLDIGGLMTWLNVSRPQVFKLMKEEELPYVKLGARTLRFDANDVALWLDRQKKSA